MVIGSRGTPEYLGVSSPTVAVRQLSIAGHMDVNREVPSYNEDALRRRISVTNHAFLPPYTVAMKYFQAQHCMIGMIFNFVSEEEFERHLRECLLQLPDINDAEACLKYCQVLMVMAFGQMYAVNIYYNADGPPGFAYFAQALQYLPDIHTNPSVLFCGVLSLIGYFMQNLIRRDAAFMYLGLAQRMALSLALHEEVSIPGFDETLKEQRRRTWWSIYSIDRIFCIKYGNPVTMHDEDISVALPNRLPHEPEYCSAVVLRHYTMLSQILSQIMDRIYRKTAKNGGQLMAAVQDIMRALIKWEQELPSELRMTSTEIHRREAVSTYLHYYQCISMTARPLLFWVVEKRLQEGTTEDWRAGLPQATTGIIEMCINAAKDTIAIMNAAADKDLVTVFGYMDGEHCFCAALVMVVVNIALPYNEKNAQSMEAGLALLESLASKGNHHLDARHQMLLQLLHRGQLRSEGDIVPDYNEPDFMPTLHQHALDGVFPPEATTDLDLLNFKAAYSRSDMNIESDLQHMSNFPGSLSWQEIEQPSHDLGETDGLIYQLQ
ncbi:hypothetical protein AMS68_002110 [Peltaster fructicola]|uniref:Xylanolytic transcriptional activator regulatory domain-containing protein n=1 Tax=Peltaster fructicola TaxID=286661 RepID=A0A6H0XPE9_9PEZI|nr:hypothetical protein AMS68_002110 [Peltaster fructicola]